MNQPPKKKSNTVVLLIVAGIGCPVLVAIIGILAAIAIPAFIGYTKQSKAAEARSNLTAMASALESYRMEYGSYPPRSLARTPASPNCPEKALWPATADPGWAELGFTPMDPIFYSYEYVAGPGAASYTIRAYGDLDCDGVESRYERTSDSPNVYIEDELE